MTTFSDYLNIFTISLWVGVFITFICKMINFVIEKIIGWFKKI